MRSLTQSRARSDLHAGKTEGHLPIETGRGRLSNGEAWGPPGVAMKGRTSGPWRGVAPCLRDVIDSASVILAW